MYDSIFNEYYKETPRQYNNNMENRRKSSGYYNSSDEKTSLVTLACLCATYLISEEVTDQIAENLAWDYFYASAKIQKNFKNG